MPEVTIARLKPGDRAVTHYARLRAQMWNVPATENEREIDQILADQEHWAVLVAERRDDTISGFLEVRLRDTADGATSSPVGYLEGWFVEPQYRRKGIGSLLVEAAEEWARSRGCAEMASDAGIDNATSIRLHQQLGYNEVDRVVRFVKTLR